MILPEQIIEISLKDQYFDLKGLSIYSALAVPTLRDHIRVGCLPYFKVKGKILVKKSDFDHGSNLSGWIKNRNLVAWLMV